MGMLLQLHACLPGRSAQGLCSSAPVTIRGSAVAAMSATPPPRSSLQRAGEIRWRRPGEEEGVGEPRGVFSQRKLRPEGGFQEIPTHYSSLPTNLGRLIPIGRSKNAPPWTVSQLPSPPGRYPAPQPRQSTVAGAGGLRRAVHGVLHPVSCARACPLDP